MSSQQTFYNSKVFKTHSDPNALGGLSYDKFDFSSLKNFFGSIADKIYIAPKKEDIAALNDFKNSVIDLGDVTKMTATEQKIANEFIEEYRDVLPDGALKDYTKTTNAAALSEKGYVAALNKTTIAAGVTKAAVVALNAVKNMALTMAISSLISFAIKEIDEYIITSKEAIEKLNELSNVWKEQEKIIHSNQKTISDISTEYEKLSKGVDQFGRVTYATNEEYERYNDLSAKIAGMFPELITYHTDINGVITAEKISVEQLTKAYKDQAQAARDAIILNASDAWSGYNKSLGDDWWTGKGKLSDLDFANKIIEAKDNAEELRDVLNSFGGYGDIQKFLGRADVEFSLNDLAKKYGEGVSYVEAMAQMIETNSKYTLDNIGAYHRDIITSLNTETSKIKPILSALLSDNYDYSTFDNETKQLVDSLVSKFDYRFYSQFENENDMFSWVFENLIAPLSDPATSKEMSDAIQTLLSPDTINLPHDQYQKAIDDALAALPAELREQVRVYLQFNFVTEDMEKQAKEKLGDIDLSQFSFEDFQIILNPKFKFSGNSAGDLRNAIEDFVNASTPPNFSAIIDPATESFKNLNTQLDSLQSAYKTFASAIDEYNQTGTLSLDTTQAILALGDEYIGYLFDENGQLQLNKEGFIALANAKLDKLEADALAAAIDNVRGLTDEATATEYLKGKTNEATEATEKNTIAELENLAAKKAAEGGDLQKATEQIITTFSQYKSVIDATRAGLGSYTDTTMGAASATNKLSDAQKKLEDSLRAEGDAAIRVIDRKIKAIQEAQKASEKDIDSQIDKIKEEKEAYEDAIDAEIDALNKRKEALQESISKYEDAASVVVDFIDKQMDAINDRKDEINDFYNEQLEALDKTNKALQDQIDREKSLEALEKARSQKVMVLKDGEFGYAVDEGAVKDVQDSHDQLLADQALQAEKDRIEAEREEKLNALEDETKRWEDYKKLWSDATAAYEREQQLLHALEVLGKDWENDILNQRTDVLNQFTEHHYNQTKALEENVLTQIDTLTKQKEDEAILFEERIEALEEQKVREAENYAARIEDLNGYKERVQERLNMIGQSWEEYQTQLDLEAKWEAALFDGMAAEIEDYADRVEEAMRRAQAAKSKGGASGSPKSPSNDDYDYRTDSSLTAGQKKQAALAEKEFGGYAAGGTVYKTGVYNVDELGDEIIVSPPKNGKFKLLEMGDKIIGSAMSSQIMQNFHDQSNALATEHFTVPMKALNMGVFGAPQGESTTHINVHNITLPNVRTGDDAQKIVDELKKLSIKAHQHTQSMRFGK